MKLTNKYIAEGMYATNGKQIWKVIDWDSKYRHALLQKIDKNGNKTDYFVVAENYELYGDENEALISWMNGDYLDDVSQSDAEEYFDDFYKKDKKINESVEKYFVGDETAKGFEVCMIEDGKKYYLSKLAKNVVDSDWSSDHTYAKHWKNKSRAEEVVDMLNSELKENKKSFKERSEENEIIVSELQDTVEYFCGLYEEDKELKGKALESLKNAVERLEVFNAIGSIYQWGVEVLNKCGIKYKGLKESKKSSRKSLKESAKPINEKNVAKFVDELNKWCDDNVHYKDVDSAKFTKQYGKLYDFGYDWDYSYGDKGDLLVFDKEETLDWYDDEVVVPFIKELAKKYGWYCEPAHSYADFMFAEL